MKISVDNEVILDLNDIKQKVLQSDIMEDVFEKDMKRRLVWVIMHKYDEVYKKFKAEWEPKLAQRGVKMIPTDPDAFAELVFSQADYKSRLQKEQPIN